MIKKNNVFYWSGSQLVNGQGTIVGAQNISAADMLQAVNNLTNQSAKFRSIMQDIENKGFHLYINAYDGTKSPVQGGNQFQRPDIYARAADTSSPTGVHPKLFRS